MGWCSGTAFFDGAMDIFWKYVPVEDRPEVLRKWYDCISEGDWDCESESNYWDLLSQLPEFQD